MENNIERMNDFIDVKDVVGSTEDNTYMETYRHRNVEIGDAFIDTHLYNADAAYDRLKLLRKIMREWKTSFNNLDRRDIPSSLIERYEKVWAELRTIEMEESDVVKFGE